MMFMTYKVRFPGNGEKEPYVLPENAREANTIASPAETRNANAVAWKSPIIDLSSDLYFMGEALRQARKAGARTRCPSAR